MLSAKTKFNFILVVVSLVLCTHIASSQMGYNNPNLPRIDPAVPTDQTVVQTSNGSSFNITYSNLLNQNCPGGYVVNGTLSNGSLRCIETSVGGNGTTVSNSTVIQIVVSYFTQFWRLNEENVTTGGQNITANATGVDYFNQTYSFFVDNLIGWWRMDDVTNDTTVLDLSGYANNGVFYGEAINRTGIFSNASWFNFSNGTTGGGDPQAFVIDLDNKETYNITNQPITISSWVYTQNASLPNQTIFSRGFPLQGQPGSGGGGTPGPNYSLQTYSFLNDSLLGWWTMDNANDTTVFDNGRYAINGTILNMGINQSDLFANSTWFDGIDDNVNGISLGKPAALNLSGQSALSISTWVRTYNNLTNQQAIFARARVGSSAGNMDYNMRLVTTAPRASFVVSDGVSLMTAASGSGATNIQNNRWYHIVGTFNGTNISIYQNGVVVSTTRNLTFGTIADHPTFTTTGIGGDLDNPSSFFNGSIDEVIVWNRSLSAQEVLALYNSSQYALYKNETILEQSTNYTMFVVNTTAGIYTCTDNQCPEGTGSGGESNATNTTFGYSLRLRADTAFPTFTISDGVTLLSATSLTNITSSRWYHISAVFNRTNITLYVDGNATASVVNNTFGNYTETATYRPTSIGGNSYMSNQYLFGGIDEVLVWNRTLTTSEIRSLYNSSQYALYKNLSLLDQGTNHTMNVTMKNGTIYGCIDNQCPNQTIIVTGSNTTVTSNFSISPLFNISSLHLWPIGDNLYDLGRNVTNRFRNIWATNITTTNIYSQTYRASNGDYGMTNTTGFWMCTDASCTAKCQAQIINGLITSCT